MRHSWAYYFRTKLNHQRTVGKNDFRFPRKLVVRAHPGLLCSPGYSRVVYSRTGSARFRGAGRRLPHRLPRVISLTVYRSLQPRNLNVSTVERNRIWEWGYNPKPRERRKHIHEVTRL